MARLNRLHVLTSGEWNEPIGGATSIIAEENRPHLIQAGPCGVCVFSTITSEKLCSGKCQLVTLIVCAQRDKWNNWNKAGQGPNYQIFIEQIQSK